MNTDRHGFKHGEITEKIIGVFYDVYNELGHGFLESVYQKSLQIALASAGLNALIAYRNTGSIPRATGRGFRGRYARQQLCSD